MSTEDIRQPCSNCHGNGGVLHDDVPLAVCGKCSGFGTVDTSVPRHIFYDGIALRCDSCTLMAPLSDKATFFMHEHEARS